MDREKIKKIVYFIFVGLVSPLIFEPASKILQSAGKGLINAGINYFFYCCGRTNAIEVVLNYAYLFLVCLLFVPILCALSALNSKTLALTKSKGFKSSANSFDQTKKDSKKTHKKGKTADILIIAYLIIYFISITIYDHIPCMYNERFNRNIVQITPYVEKEEVDILLSEWVSMETKSDYDAIYARISEIKQKNNLK